MMMSKKDMMASKARPDVMTFFECLLERRFSDAERAVEEIRKKSFGNTEFKDGYVNGLEGMLISSRSGDDRDFFNRAPFDRRSMNKYRKDFSEFAKSGVNTPFDVGFFSAWSDLMHYRLNEEKKS